MKKLFLKNIFLSLKKSIMRKTKNNIELTKINTLKNTLIH